MNGFPFEVFEACLGRPGRMLDVPAESADQLFRSLASAVRNGHPATAWTRPDSTEVPFVNSGIFPDHLYTVLGAVEDGGKQYVELRNPWKTQEPIEPAGNGARDGVFRLPMETFCRYFVGAGIGD